MVRIFLSHACGGEQAVVANFLSFVFLSHACGGELCEAIDTKRAEFLSHACGGEHNENGVGVFVGF